MNKTQETGAVLESFSMRFGPLFRFMYFGSCISIPIVVAAAVLQIALLSWKIPQPLFVVLGLVMTLVLSVILVLVALGVFTSVATWILVWKFKVFFGEEGVRCFDFWGRYFTVLWPNLQPIGVVNLLGARFLRVRATDTNRVIWVPLQMRDSERLISLVESYEVTPGLLSSYLERSPQSS